ncbi:MAG: multidrug efflux RND transporter permease subunit [Myxococcaceae bacterium]
MSISEPFIRRPIATSLLAAALLLAGAAAYSQLPMAPLPRVDFPAISVSAALPGASPETMASAVATPLERRFGRIAGINEITSSSTLGNTSITLQFDLNRDVDAAARDVQAAINAAASELPTNLPSRPNYRKVNPADTPILILSLTSDTLPLAQVYDAAITILAQKISQVHGVGQVTVGGGQQPAVRVQVDPAALAGVGLTLEDVRTALGVATIDQPKGSLNGTAQSLSLATSDQLFNADAFRPLVIAQNGNAIVRLGDVATVFDDVENNRTAAWTNGVRSVLIIIRRQPGANIIDTNERVKAILPSLMSSVSPAIKEEVCLDRTQTIRGSVRDVERTLVLSVFLVVLVVFAFLRSFRATAIPSVAVPLSLVSTFGVMYLLNYSVNNLSLMAMTIATGFVIDDAIVVTENIARYVELGEKPMAAAIKGARQIGFTIVSMTVSLLAVFIPILMMQGVVGRLFREFAVTLSVAIAISMVVSLTLTPMMSARLLGHGEKKHGKLYVWSERAFDATLAAYGRGLTWVLGHRRLMLAVVGLALGLTVVLFILIPKGLFPQQDNGLLVGTSDAPQDVSFFTMRTRQKAIDQVVQSSPDVAHAMAFIGGSGTTNTGFVFVDLKPRPPRKRTADDVITWLRPRLAQVEGIALYLQSGQDVRIGGRSSRTQYQYTLQAADLDVLRIWAPRLLAEMKKMPDLRDVATDQQTNGLELDVDIDRDTASRLGISAKLIDDTLYDAYGQRQVATRYTQLNQYRVVLEVKPEYLESPDALDDLYVRSAAGGLVPLGAVTKRGPSTVPLAINHQGQFPSITLSFNLAPGKSLSDAVASIQKAKQSIGMPASVIGGFQGTAQAFQDSLASEPMLILLALLTVYVVLGVLYESYVHPLTILSTLPTAGVGALLALMVCHVEFNVIGLIGIILLIGIVKKNAIMMIDFAIEAERDEGLSPREAIYRASMLRFRPIMMTTAAALLGALPLALGTGLGSELRKPLGISIVGGLLVSQVLTLFTTPVIYLALDRFSRHRKNWKRPVPLDASVATSA